MNDEVIDFYEVSLEKLQSKTGTLKWEQEVIDNMGLVGDLTFVKGTYSSFKENVENEIQRDSRFGLFLTRVQEDPEVENDLEYIYAMLCHLMNFILDLKKQVIDIKIFSQGIQNLIKFIGRERWINIVRMHFREFFISEEDIALLLPQIDRDHDENPDENLTSKDSENPKGCHNKRAVSCQEDSSDYDSSFEKGEPKKGEPMYDRKIAPRKQVRDHSSEISSDDDDEEQDAPVDHGNRSETTSRMVRELGDFNNAPVNSQPMPTGRRRTTREAVSKQVIYIEDTELNADFSEVSLSGIEDSVANSSASDSESATDTQFLEATGTDVSQFTVPILRKQCKSKGLKTTGKKKELVERLNNHSTTSNRRNIQGTSTLTKVSHDQIMKNKQIENDNFVKVQRIDNEEAGKRRKDKLANKKLDNEDRLANKKLDNEDRLANKKLDNEYKLAKQRLKNEENAKQREHEMKLNEQRSRSNSPMNRSSAPPQSTMNQSHVQHTSFHGVQHSTSTGHRNNSVDPSGFQSSPVRNVQHSNSTGHNYNSSHSTGLQHSQGQQVHNSRGHHHMAHSTGLQQHSQGQQVHNTRGYHNLQLSQGQHVHNSRGYHDLSHQTGLEHPQGQYSQGDQYSQVQVVQDSQGHDVQYWQGQGIEHFQGQMVQQYSQYSHHFYAANPQFHGNTLSNQPGVANFMRIVQTSTANSSIANAATQHSHAVNSQLQPGYGNALRPPVGSQASNTIGIAQTSMQNIHPNLSRGERYYTIATLDLLPGEGNWPHMSRVASACGVRNCNNLKPSGSRHTWARLYSGDRYWNEFIECTCTKGKNGTDGARLRMHRTKTGQIKIQYDSWYRSRCMHSGGPLVFYPDF